MTGLASRIAVVISTIALVHLALGAMPDEPPVAAPGRQPARLIAPQTPASTQPGGPSNGPAGPQLPTEFDILRTRNPFAHGKARPGGPGAPAGPESMFVLKGVAQAGDRYTAFIEDATTKHVTELAAGSPVALGRVKSVDIDTIEYEAMGTSRRIEVGQNLAGQVVPPTPASQPVAVQPPAPPGGAGPMPGPPGGPMPPGTKARAVRGAPPGAEPGPPPDAPPDAPQEK